MPRIRTCLRSIFLALGQRILDSKAAYALGSPKPGSLFGKPYNAPNYFEMKTRECPSCAMEISNNKKECPICGYEFPSNPFWVKALALLLIALFVLFMIL